MEIHQLKYFLAVVRTGSFTRAAEECHVSQPSLSAQLAKLEEELGGALLERSRRGCFPSSRGELLIPRARDILRQIETVRREADDFDKARAGRIRLGCLPTTGAYVLPPLLKEYRRQYRDVRIRLREGSSPALAGALLNRRIELAIMDQAGLQPGLAGEELFREPLYIALPPEHPLGRQKALDIRALEGQPLILMRRGHGFHQIVDDVLKAAGVRPRVIYESSEIETVQSLVRAGMGLSIVPRMICVHGDIRYRRILASPEGPEKTSGEGPSRTLLMAFREDARLSPAALRLIELARVCLGELFGGERTFPP